MRINVNRNRTVSLEELRKYQAIKSEFDNGGHIPKELHDKINDLVSDAFILNSSTLYLCPADRFCAKVLIGLLANEKEDWQVSDEISWEEFSDGSWWLSLWWD